MLDQLISEHSIKCDEKQDLTLYSHNKKGQTIKTQTFFVKMLQLVNSIVFSEV